MFGLSIPPMYKYAIYGLIISIILGSAFAYGYNKAENKYIAKIAKLEADAQGIKSRLDTALANVKIETSKYTSLMVGGRYNSFKGRN